MNENSAGGFRRNVFGGFNREDVLNHIREVYGELGQFRKENEALRDRCEALEEQLRVKAVDPPDCAPEDHGARNLTDEPHVTHLAPRRARVRIARRK